MISDRRPDLASMVTLYDAVGWTPYTADPETLAKAIAQTPYLRTVWHAERLVGLCRALTDGFFMCYLQDLLVHPDVQGQGIGKALLTQCLADHAHVRQFMLLTDDRPEQLGLYGSVGLANLADLQNVKLNAFLRMRGIELT